MTEQYPKDAIERAAKRLFALAEDPDVAPGVYDLDFFRERVATDPADWVRDEDQLRCEFYAEAGDHYDENGEPTCNDPVTTAIIGDKTVDCDGVLYSCDSHSSEFAKQVGFLKMEPLRDREVQ